MSKMRDLLEELDLKKTGSLEILAPQLFVKYDVKIKNLLAEMEADEKIMADVIQREGSGETAKLLAFRRIKADATILLNRLANLNR